MFAIAPLSPANSPVISSPLPPATGATSPPPLLEPSAPPQFNSPPSPPSEASPAPSVTSPTTSVPPPALAPMETPLPNSAPPVNSPAIQVPPPEVPLAPASSHPIPSNKNPNPQPVQSPPSPATLNPPAEPFPSPETPAPPLSPLPSRHRKVAPAPLSPLPSRHRKVAPARPSPAATFSPPSPPEAKSPAPKTTSPPSPLTFFPSSKPPVSPRAARAPTRATVPERKLPPSVPLPATSQAPQPSRSLPVAVEVEKHSEFNMPSGLIVGIVFGGIFLVLVVSVVYLLCRNSNKKKQKNLYTHQHEEPSPYNVGSMGSNIIRGLSNNDPSHHVTVGGGGFGSVNSEDVTAVPNHASSIAFGAVNGIFTYEELVVATNGFSEANLLGEGGFGYVSKGVLPCGKEIAVKQLKTGSQQGEREFQAEVETISRVHHKHLVELVGYCVTRAERLLVYEFIPNNTLEFHLHGEGKPVVEWEKRIKIALGSAKGLAYLHEDCNPAIIHRDIKASNILLDFNFEAKVSDFGLAKIFPSTDGCITHLTTRVVGTFGYLAPEYASSGKLTDKSDVYSYGVMLLELITGRPPITATGTRNESLVDWARPLLAQALQDGHFNNLVDPRLQNNYEADEMARMITCAAACVRHSARLRPRMSQIAGALEGMVSITDLVGDITPGQTTLFNWSDSSNYDAIQYQQDLRDFNLALSFQYTSSA